MIQRILYIFLCICLAFFLWNIFLKEPSEISLEKSLIIQEKLSILTPEEKKDLEYLFERFFFIEHFSYPLFGSKPISIGRLLEKEPFLNGWNAWKKISSHFYSEKFVLDEYEHRGHSFVLLANLELVEKTYQENEFLFKEAFNGRMSSENLKNCLKRRDDLFQELLQNDLIFGILLGYGAENAYLFARNQQLKPFSSLHPIFYFFSKVMPPCFACDPKSKETMELRKRYQQERSVIVKMSKKDPLLIRMLLLFMERQT